MTRPAFFMTGCTLERMVERFFIRLPSGIELSCRGSGSPGAPVLLFLHGFPEAAFVWDDMLEHFASSHRCIAPNLRGFERSSSPTDVEAYRAKHLVADIAALIASQGGRVDALVAHDWGGAVAWNLAAEQPDLMRRLVIINSPHPATFLRDLQGNPEQQAASGYMNFLCRPDAEALLGENDFARFWPFLASARHAEHPADEPRWLTEAVRDRYRSVWRAGLTGGCNYYRASPLKPPVQSDAPVLKIAFAPEAVTVHVPTLVLWGEGDVALLPSLLDGLDTYVPNLRLVRVVGGSHWIVHEFPQLVAAEIERTLAAD